MSQRPTEFSRATQLLLRDRAERFPYERALRQFQFQMWLFGTDSQAKSFARSAPIFGSALISSRAGMLGERSRRTPADRLLRVIANECLEGIINECFQSRSLYGLLRVDSSLLVKAKFFERRDKINKIIEFTHLWLWLSVHLPPANLSRTRAVFHEAKEKKSSRNTLGISISDGEHRHLYLYSASKVARDYLDIEFEGSWLSHESLLPQMTKKSEDANAFRVLCGAVKETAKQLELELSPALTAAWSDVKSEAPEVDPVDAKVQERARELSEKRAPRRSATETKRKSRQLVKK